ncbi:MAG: hypothetical protein ACTSU5_13545 [Promethearchaeota archaeon]
MSERNDLGNELQSALRERGRANLVEEDPDEGGGGEATGGEGAQDEHQTQHFSLRDTILEELRALFQDSNTNVGDEDERNPDERGETAEREVARVSPEDREYYIEYHGFDPWEDRITPVPSHGVNYRYQVFFPLARDPDLQRAGIEIGARVDVDEKMAARNRIVFRKGGRETVVDCIHTAVCTLDVSEAFGNAGEAESRILEMARTTENRQVDLPPEEHFVSLKSYVAGIADLGIANIMGATYQSESINPETLPFGFNRFMQRQVMGALGELDSKATRTMVREFVLELVDSVPPDWLARRVKLLQEMYDIQSAIFSSPGAFEIVTSAIDTDEFKLLAAAYPNTHEDILLELVSEGSREVKLAVALNPNIPVEACKVLLAERGDKEMIERLGRNPNLPAAVIERILYLNEDFGIRKALARNPTTPPSLLKRLLEDPDYAVKIWARANPNATREVLLGVNPRIRGNPRQVVTFNGQMVTRYEAEALGQFELLKGVSIPGLEELSRDDAGFVARDGHVVGLNLRGFDVASLSFKITRLHWVKNLYIPDIPRERMNKYLLDWIEDLEMNGCVVEMLELDPGFISLRDEMLRELRRLQAIMRGDL